ncbi:rhomboid family intramembrane serine protease [Leptospira koniambonensis]|uniref:rhomboid family intramembrane serine protease n=1 Tax=Leptospira koniambonensis TaxID=2484950 RepID=UPI003EBA1AD1
MNCPRCSSLLIKKKSSTDSHYACNSCEGKIYSRFDFIRYYSGDIAKNLIQSLRGAEKKNSTPYNIKCPQCYNNFLQIQLFFKEEYHPIDYCNSCDYIWLDKSEIDVFYKANSGSVTRKLEFEAYKLKEHLEKDREVEVEYAESPKERIYQILGLPIEKDYESLKKLALLTWSIAGICILFSIFNWLTTDDLSQFGLLPSDPFRNFGLSFITSFFQHANLLHLLGNMYFLVIFGDNIENELGKIKTLILLVTAAIFGDLIDLIVRFDSNVPSIGASGGIAGFLTFYCLRFQNNKLSISFPQNYRHWLERRYWNVKAPYFALYWIVAQLIGIFSISNINYTVHLSGAAIGILTYYYYRKK